MNESELNIADRYLLWRTKPGPTTPTDEQWHWRYRQPPAVTVPNEGEVTPNGMSFEYTSSLRTLEEKGLLWRFRGPAGERGWGLTNKGAKAKRAIKESDEPARWEDAIDFWRELPKIMADPASRQPPAATLRRCTALLETADDGR